MDEEALALDSLSPFELQDELGRYAAKPAAGEALDADDFARWLLVSQHPLSFPIHLAQRYGVVALPGRGFEAASWSVRISLANLPDDAYTRVAEAVHATIDDLHTTFVHQQGEPR